MILCNNKVHEALDAGKLIIKPEPSPRLPTVGGGHCPYDTHTVDLRLAEEIIVPRDKGLINIDLARPGNVAQLIQDHSDRMNISEVQPFHLKPQQFILAKTMEWIELPITPGCTTCLAARIEGKSSRARFGLLIHFTAPTVHPGFKGTLTLEMINLGPWEVVLKPGLPIAQLIIEEVLGCPNDNPSQFQGQSTAAGIAGNGAPK